MEEEKRGETFRLKLDLALARVRLREQKSIRRIWGTRVVQRSRAIEATSRTGGSTSIRRTRAYCPILFRLEEDLRRERRKTSFRRAIVRSSRS